MSYIGATLLTALVGAVVGLLFRRIERRIDRMEQTTERRHKEHVRVRFAERELLLSEAHISALTARCVRGEKVNGELEKAEKEIEKKKRALDLITHRLFIDKTEG